ncbi:protein phosphatase 2C 70-like [Oryza brachyantha]|uniref:protein phosphatase 2C 70-like n=1 Tax=Oryza brachyantha TaxID=4533 RepID=UPI0003EA95E4|nr:protein phosphatase 2C 70-like [Oryza brachyantha]
MAIPPLAVSGVAVATLAVLGLAVFACRRWRRGCTPSAPPPPAPSSSSSQDDDINRPLISDKLDEYSGSSNELCSSTVDESGIQIDRRITSPRTHGIAEKGATYPTESHIIEGGIHVIDVTNSKTEDLNLGDTLKRTAVANGPTPDVKHIRRDSGENIHTGSIPTKDTVVGSNLALEVIAGPSHGINHYMQSGNKSMLPVTLGRVHPNHLVIKDSEVSGKHAQIDWNANKLKWEIVDMGSLNGTFLNSRSVNHPNVGSRHWGEPAELADGDIVTLGSSSKVSVKIALQNQQPVGVGIASDPMIARRTGKKLNMEDVSCCQYPLVGVEKFGLFGIFDGHGGDGAAIAASRILPQSISNILSQQETKERVLSYQSASDVLRHAFALTEAALHHQYEGCTATILLIWFDQNEDCFAQCANLGDSACVMSVNGETIAMTEDHRVISTTERTRMANLGHPLKDGESRICGLNLGRMLGDKFLKEQDSRFSSEPYVSQAVRMTKACSAFALIASDGLWDVISTNKAVQLVLEGKQRYTEQKTSAEKVAHHVLSEARKLRTKDNTSVIFVDLGAVRRDP